MARSEAPDATDASAQTRVSGVSRSFIGKPLDTAALTAISQALAAAYAKTDVALYTVEAPQQDFAGGLVRIRVIEGYVEHVYLKGAGSKGVPPSSEITSLAAIQTNTKARIPTR